jgi:hypothetical protein
MASNNFCYFLLVRNGSLGLPTAKGTVPAGSQYPEGWVIESYLLSHLAQELSKGHVYLTGSIMHRKAEESGVVIITLITTGNFRHAFIKT